MNRKSEIETSYLARILNYWTLSNNTKVNDLVTLTVTFSLKTANFGLPSGAYVFHIRTCFLNFLYARLQTGRIMVWWCPSVHHSFPHFSPTCFDIFIWNFVYHFIFMHIRSSLNAINFCHFLQELCSFLCPRIEWSGAYCFCPVCLFVCLSVCLFVCLFVCLLSTLTFAITFEPLEIETSYLACILY